MNNIFKIVTITAISIFLNTNASFAGEGHDHAEHQHEGHQEKSHENDRADEEKEAHEHESNEQGSHHDHEEDSHDEHGDEDEHNHESDSHDDHGHGDHHDGEHHDEMKTEIDEEAALSSGIAISKAKSGVIFDDITLTGRIILNKNTTSNIGARFSGIVKKVSANWGDKVKKGQVVATIESNESLKAYEVRSPLSGVILERNVSVGDVVEGGSLFTVADVSNIWVKFHIFPKDISKINKGDAITIKNISDGKTTSSKIKLVFPTADELSQTIVAITEIDNTEGFWKPGMVVEGLVQNNLQKANVVVENSAIQNMGNKDVIFVKEGNSYEAKEISKGRTNSKYTEIVEGLNLGQKYVSSGSFIIKADIQKSAAAHEH
jgi:cobalt-zinc-cadmium efflux system membrane fusion protein